MKSIFKLKVIIAYLKRFYVYLKYQLFTNKAKKTEILIKKIESKQNVFKKKWNFRKHSKRCFVCHKPFYGYRNIIGKVCSKECYNKLQSMVIH